MSTSVLSLLQCNPAIISRLCLVGTAAAIGGILAAALPYRGRQGERYSPFNHFISELGERGISRLAWVFNLCLILCGLLLLPAVLCLGLRLPGLWAKLGMAAGTVAAISLSLIGVFSMDHLTPHIRAAVTYFRAGLLMILGFTLAILLQPQGDLFIARSYSLAGIPAILSYAYFLLYSRINFNPEDSVLSPLDKPRPRFWRLAVSEWLILVTTIPWLLTVFQGIS